MAPQRLRILVSLMESLFYPNTDGLNDTVERYFNGETLYVLE